MTDRIDESWERLRECLAMRARTLDADVRGYPTPIARCDEQLTKAIADRDAAYRRLRQAEELEASRARLTPHEWRARLAEFTLHIDADDDDAAMAAAHGRLASVLGQ